MFTDHGKLAAAEIAFFGIFFILAISNVIFVPRGYHRDTGWIYITGFCLLKIIGSGLIIHIQLTSSTSVDLISTAGIFNGIALSPLLSAAVGFANTAAKDIPSPHPLFQRLMRLLHISVLVGLILGIVGGTQSASAKANSSDASQAVTLLVASSALFMVSWAFLSISTLFLMHQIHTGAARTLIKAVALSLPFFLIRVVYSLLVNTHTSKTNPGKGYNKYSQTRGELVYPVIMGFLIELAIVSVFTIAGMRMHRFDRESGEGSKEAQQENGVAVEMRG